MHIPSMTATAEQSLDPQDWDAFRALGHQMIDDLTDYLRTVRDRPAWQSPPAEVRARLREPLPLAPQGDAAVYDAFRRDVLPYPTGNVHPRFWGWVQGGGTPLAMLSQLCAAAMNPHLAGFDQSASLVEAQVLDWLAELMGMPGASGVLVGTGSMANTLGLAVARNARAGFKVREHGNATGPQLVCYGSLETHVWAQKAVEFLGLGNAAFRRIPCDADYQVNIAELEVRIEEDRHDGIRPFAIIANAGTVNTGAVDDLEALADIAAREKLWLHVDGAFGAMARLGPASRALVRGIERADSIAFDLHKWGSLPFDVACLLVRDAAAHRAAFALGASYLATTDRGPIAGGLPFADRGLDLSRSFRALEVWMAFKSHGVAALGAVIDQNVAQARYLADLVVPHAELELLAPVALNVVCFRYRAPGLGDEALNAVNREVLLRIQESGFAVPSGTTLAGRYAIRVAHVNHRSRREDFAELVEHVVTLGREVAAGR